MHKTSVLKKPSAEAIVQFSIYASNRVGRLNDILGLFQANDVHVMALCAIDNTDTAIVRLVVDYVEPTRKLLKKNGIAFNEVEVIGVELEREDQLKLVTCALVQAEINIHYVYPFLIRPHGHTGLILSLEDQELATEILTRHQIKVLRRSDIAR